MSVEWELSKLKSGCWNGVAQRNWALGVCVWGGWSQHKNPAAGVWGNHQQRASSWSVWAQPLSAINAELWRTRWPTLTKYGNQWLFPAEWKFAFSYIPKHRLQFGACCVFIVVACLGSSGKLSHASVSFDVGFYGGLAVTSSHHHDTP